MRSRWIYAFVLALGVGFLSLSHNPKTTQKVALDTAMEKLPSVQLQVPAVEAAKPEPPVLKFGDPMPANAFTELAKLVNPAVVNISTTMRPKRMRPQQDPFFDMLEQFYGMRQLPQMQRPATALGTGFIIRENGLILTNNHVIAGADTIAVQINENSDKHYEAKVIGSDDRTDIALIKIEGKEFPTVKLGTSKETEVGDWVAAFGNPYGNGHTMTKGIISAKGRDISEINRFPLLQTDAPINPGNSGGPLVNLRGEVIGVNSAIDARAQGIGFAIPIDEVKSILPQLENSIRIKKGYIGVLLGMMSPDVQMNFGLENSEGAFVGQVEPKGPADQAGVQAYDVITEFNGKKIRDTADLTYAVADTPVGTTVKMKIIRDGKPKTLDIKVAEKNDEKIAKAFAKEQKRLGAEAAPYDLGFSVSNINESLMKEFDLPRDLKKPVIVSVDQKSQAFLAGLLPGDIILDVNRVEAVTASQSLKQLKKGRNTLRIFREGAIIFVILKT